ncbi:MAG: hypothetical protein QM820_26550 [Minicystis sp.]
MSRSPILGVAAAGLALIGCADDADLGRAAGALHTLSLGPEQGTDAPSFGRAEQPQHSVSLAPSASGLLMVWDDGRRNEGGDVYATRATALGAPLDPAGVAVTEAPGTQEQPRVASDGKGWLVVWTDYRSTYHSVFGRRVDAAGQPLDDAGGFPISTGQGAREMADVAFDGNNYVVVWQDRRGPAADIYAARVTPDGKVLDADGVLLSTDVGEKAYPRVSPGPGHSLVTWQQALGEEMAPALIACRIDASAQPLDGGGIALDPAVTPGVPAAAAFGSGIHAVVYQAAEPGGGDVMARRLDADGLLLDATPLSISQDQGEQGGPAVAFDGTSFLVAWHHRTAATDFDVRARRLTPAGSLLGTADVVITDAPQQQARPAIALSEGGAVVAWDDLPPWQNMDIFAARWDANDAVSAPVLVELGGQRAARPGAGGEQR